MARRAKEEEIREHGLPENLDPIHLFSVRSRGQVFGVFYLPQKGVGMEGFRGDGSIRSIARHINALGNASVADAGAMNPKDLSEETIITTFSAWASPAKKDPLEDAAEDNLIDYNSRWQYTHG